MGFKRKLDDQDKHGKYHVYFAHFYMNLTWDDNKHVNRQHPFFTKKSTRTTKKTHNSKMSCISVLVSNTSNNRTIFGWVEVCKISISNKSCSLPLRPWLFVLDFLMIFAAYAFPVFLLTHFFTTANLPLS